MLRKHKKRGGDLKEKKNSHNEKIKSTPCTTKGKTKKGGNPRSSVAETKKKAGPKFEKHCAS